MLPLNAGQIVFVFLEGGSLYSDPEQLISFNGIHYDPSSPDPANPMTQIAWSVQRSTSLTAPSSDVDLTFDTIEVNEGLAYNPETGEVTVTVSGYYLINLSAGALAGLPVNMRLMRNNVQEAALVRDSTTHSGVDTIGRTVLAVLIQGDVVKVQIGTDSGVYSDSFHQTSFTGFLLVNR